MKRLVQSRGRAVALAVLVLAGGCAKVPPTLTEAEGTVTLNGQPLPNAQVQFVPDLADFGAEYNSVGTTDEQGHFRLTCQGNGQNGAVIAKHRVLVIEAPVPAELRGQSSDSQQKLAAYQAKLKNRPIPTTYSSVGQTPLVIEVTADQKTYAIKLTRP
jgi:hypothetical protein